MQDIFEGLMQDIFEGRQAENIILHMSKHKVLFYINSMW